jgi:SAM-dependent methyltransferase
MELINFYNNWAKSQLEDEIQREPKLKWKAINLLNLLLRNGEITFNAVCEIGGSEGIVLDIITKVINSKINVNYEISDVFCEIGRTKYKNIKYINKDFLDNPEYFDLVILSDIVEHVEDDDLFLNTISRYCKYLVIKIPIEKSFFSSGFYQTMRFKKIPEEMKFGKNHINGHLRGYTIRQAINYLSKYYNIIDLEISDVYFFNPSKKKRILKKLFGEKIFILLYGGAFFAFGESKCLHKEGKK